MPQSSLQVKAHEVFTILKAKAKAQKTLTYGDIERQTGYSAFYVVPRVLGWLWRWCEKNGYPHINAIVVSKRTGLPGQGYTPQGKSLTHTQFEATKSEVFSFPWDSVGSP